MFVDSAHQEKEEGKRNKRVKKKRMATIKRRRGILDTLDISERRRERLLKELLDNPFSARLNKAVADIEFVADEVEN